MGKLKWSDISKYRGELFGISCISVILLHYFDVLRPENTKRVFYLIARLYNGAIGSVGVDFFVFLSGFGLYYSLSRGGGLKRFYQKRFQRVLLPYLIWGLVFWIIKDFLILGESLPKFLYDYSLLSFWGSGVQTFWYVAFIGAMYLAAPLLFKTTRTKSAVFLCALALGLVSVACYFLSRDYFSHVEIALQRLPYFVIGMYCGKLAKEETVIPGKLAVFLILAVPVKIVLGAMDHPFARLFNGYYAVFLIVFYALIRNRMGEMWRPFFAWLSKVGGLSLELYILHIGIRNLMGTLELPLHNPLLYLAHVAAAIPLALLLARVQDIRLFQLRGKSDG